MIKLAKITKALSTAITAVLLITFICTVGVMTVIENSDTLFSEKSDETDIKTLVVDTFNENFVSFDRFLSLYSTTQRLLGTSVYDDAGYKYVIRDSENNFHLNTVRNSAAPYADAIAELSGTLAKADIPFLYLQAPVKEMPHYTKYPLGIDYYSDDNAADMIEQLEKRGVDHLSLSEKFADEKVAPSTMFYRTDHHWTTETAFTAFGYAVSYLNENYGLSLDAESCNPEKWISETQPKSFLGSIGRRVGQESTGLDDYTFLEPSFETSYQVYNPNNSKTHPTWEGTFHDVFVREHVLHSENVEANRYASYFEFDFSHLIIYNQLLDNDEHILIIKDSFALPFTAFLSTTASRIDMIDLRGFEGSVTDYILEISPDIVVMLYSGSSFADIMYQFTD